MSFVFVLGLILITVVIVLTIYVLRHIYYYNLTWGMVFILRVPICLGIVWFVFGLGLFLYWGDCIHVLLSCLPGLLWLRFASYIRYLLIVLFRLPMDLLCL